MANSDAVARSAGAAPGAPRGFGARFPGMQIFIKSLNGKTITLDVEPSSTINFMKAEITRRVGLNPNSQRLVLNGHQLVVDALCTLLEVGIAPNTTLILVWPSISGRGLSRPFWQSLQLQ